MDFLPTVPREPLARFRLLALWLAVFVTSMNTILVPLIRGWNAGALIGATSSALLLLWWVWGYRRAGWPAWGWVVDPILLILTASTSPVPLRGLGIFYAGIQLRALFVSRGQLVFLPLSYAVARILSVVFWPIAGLYGPMSATIALVVDRTSSASRCTSSSPRSCARLL